MKAGAPGDPSGPENIRTSALGGARLLFGTKKQKKSVWHGPAYAGERKPLRGLMATRPASWRSGGGSDSGGSEGRLSPSELDGKLEADGAPWTKLDEITKDVPSRLSDSYALEDGANRVCLVMFAWSPVLCTFPLSDPFDGRCRALLRLIDPEGTALRVHQSP